MTQSPGPKKRPVQYPSMDERAEIKRQILDRELSLGEAVRAMRKITRLTQVEYAERVLKIAPRVLMEVERGRGNPTLETLNKIGKPFGFEVGFVSKPRL